MVRSAVRVETVGVAMRRQWAALPLGELHDVGTCALCGQVGEAGRSLRRTILLSTHAGAMVCTDAHSCIRRRSGKRKGRVD